MIDESNILYVGQRLKTVTIRSLHKSCYLDHREELQSIDISDPKNYLGYSVGYSCDCDTTGSFARRPTTIEHFLKGYSRTGREGTFCARCHDFITKQNTKIIRDTSKMSLYYVRYNTTPPLYKIGVSNTSMYKRFGKWLTSGNVVVVKIIEYKTRKEAFAEEARIKREYKDKQYLGGVDYAPETGHTEMFIEDVLGLDTLPKQNIKLPTKKLENFNINVIFRWVEENVIKIHKSEAGCTVVSKQGIITSENLKKAVRKLMNGITDTPDAPHPRNRENFRIC